MPKSTLSNAGDTVLFVDPGIPDLAMLLAGIVPGRRVFVLEAASDGVRAIADILDREGLAGLSAIDVVAHGAPGSVRLGDATLDDSYVANNDSTLRRIGRALAPGATLALHACDVAGGPEGNRFLPALSSALGGATVAAATHPVGDAARGGSWTLDASTGAPHAASPFSADLLASYRGLLAATNDTLLALPSGWTLSTDNLHIYKVNTANIVVGTAAAAAAGEISGQSYLATITSASENSLVFGLAGGSRVALGATDTATQGTWQWTVGPEAGQVFYIVGTGAVGGAYTNWSSGNPSGLDGLGNPEDYLIMTPAGQWNDASTPGNSGLPSIGYAAEAGTGGTLYAGVGEDSIFAFTGAALLANDDSGSSLVSVSALSANGARVSYNSGTGIITYDPTAAATIQALGAGGSLSDTFTYTVTDGIATSSATVTLTANGAAETFTLTAAATAGYIEQAPATILSSGFAITSVGSEFIAATVAITAGQQSGDTLATTTSGTSIVASWDSATGVLTLSGSDTREHYEQVLRAVTLANATNDEPTNAGANATRTIGWSVGDGATFAAPVATTVTVTGVNDQPTTPTAPATYAGTPGVSFVVGGTAGNAITFADVDGLNGTHVATFSVHQGTLSATSSGGVTVGGTATARTLTGTVSALNTYLQTNHLGYVATSSDVVDITLNDLGATGLGGADTSSAASIYLNVTTAGTTSTIATSTDYSALSLSTTNALTFTAAATATFASTQFSGVGAMSHATRFTGNGGDNDVTVNMAAAGTFSAHGFQFASWTATTDFVSNDLLLINGSTGNDTITGSSVVDEILAGAGNDVLGDGGGADLVFGGGGGDTFTSGGGVDQWWGAADSDTADYSAESAIVYVDLRGQVGFVGGTLADTMNSVENATGGRGADVLVGDTGANTLRGGGDLLFGQEGDDVLLGGTAWGESNQLWGGTGNDTASYAGETSAVTASLAGHWAYVGGVAATDLRDTYNSIENLTGGSGNDVLVGDNLDNILTGGVGADQLYGGTGADTFVYAACGDSNTTTGYDTVADFVAGVDKVDLRAFATDAAHVQIVSSGAATKLFVEVTPGVFNGATDLAVAFIGLNALTTADILF